jgi:hypothetical protein
MFPYKWLRKILSTRFNSRFVFWKKLKVMYWQAQLRYLRPLTMKIKIGTKVNPSQGYVYTTRPKVPTIVKVFVMSTHSTASISVISTR